MIDNGDDNDNNSLLNWKMSPKLCFCYSWIFCRYNYYLATVNLGPKITPRPPLPYTSIPINLDQLNGGPPHPADILVWAGIISYKYCNFGLKERNWFLKMPLRVEIRWVILGSQIYRNKYIGGYNQGTENTIVSVELNISICW